jgi:hypothetical protein
LGDLTLTACQLGDYQSFEAPDGFQALAAAAKTKIRRTSSNGLGKRRRIFQATKLILMILHAVARD